MHHWQEEYFDEDYDEKQQILKQIAKEQYENMIKTNKQYENMLKGIESYEYKGNTEPRKYYPESAA